MRKEEGTSSRCRPNAVRAARSHLASPAEPGGGQSTARGPLAPATHQDPTPLGSQSFIQPSIHSLEPQASRRHLRSGCRDRRGSHTLPGEAGGGPGPVTPGSPTLTPLPRPPLLQGRPFHTTSQAWLLKSLPSHSRGDKTVCPQAPRLRKMHPRNLSRTPAPPCWPRRTEGRWNTRLLRARLRHPDQVSAPQRLFPQVSEPERSPWSPKEADPSQLLGGRGEGGRPPPCAPRP